MQMTQTAAEKIIADMGMDDMPLILVHPEHVSLGPDWFAQYKNEIRKFLLSLNDSVQDLAFMNLTQDGFMGLLTGNAIPDNTSIRFRIPPMFGGAINMENMFMCATFPFAHNMDRFIIMQCGNDAIWLPNPAKKIYIPTHLTTGGDGGNATSDRLSQLAAQLAGEHGIE